ncbi:acetyl-CoA hydrolase [Elasticomyces elasticus]|nr:acetyl-CoA hydrolase [Elasticomyces elasticus]
MSQLQASALLKSRVRRPSYLKKLAKAEDLVDLFPNGTYIGWSGFTGVGYPKKVPTMLAEHVEKNNLQGKLKYNLFVGASSGAETENRWAKNNMIERRSPHQVGKEIAKGINNGNIQFFDKHLSMFPVDLMYGFYTKHKANNKLDVAIVEASAITEDGGIIPGASVGASPEMYQCQPLLIRIQMAEKIIIEVNTAAPSFEGLHDITMTDLPPRRKPYLIMRPEDRIGTPHIPIDPERVVAIVESDYPDQTLPNAPEDENSRAIARHLIEFLKHEVAVGRMPENLLPLQSGIGNIANAVVGGLSGGEANFKNLKVWTEVLQDSFLDLFDSGNLEFATATSIRFSPDGFQRFYDKYDEYAPKLLLRSQAVSNSPEIIRRLGVIGMNTPVEVDIYAHANSTCVMGSRMLNGLGGSADFLRSAKYSIMHTPSTRPTKTDPHGVSCIVPMCTHVDQTEHDLDMVVTEQGFADVRGMSPRERAREIIKKCAHPDYRPILQDYFDKAEFECLRKGWGHEPHLLWNAFDMHKHLNDHGTMKLPTWG